MFNPSVNGKIQGLFKAFGGFSSTFQGKINFQGLSRQSCIFKYLPSLCEPCSSGEMIETYIRRNIAIVKAHQSSLLNNVISTEISTVGSY